jgi:hypothetical protein
VATSTVGLVTHFHVIRISHDCLDHVLEHGVPRYDGVHFGAHVTVL